MDEKVPMHIIGVLIPSRMDEYKRFAEREGEKGIFTRKTRRRLVGASGIPGRNRTMNDFWYDQRNRVRAALKDLEIFLMVADPSNVDQVFTFENVKPVIDSLLWNRGPQSDAVVALIAQYLIESGFTYLRRHKADLVTEIHEQTINHALDISRLLAAHFAPENERRWYSSWFDKEEEEGE